MSLAVTKLNYLRSNTFSNTLNILVRYGHHLRGKPPGVARTLQQRLDELNYKDPELHHKVDIGLPHIKDAKLNSSQRIEVLKSNRHNSKLEEQARHKTLSVDLDEVRKDWINTVGPQHIKQIAEHYGVFEHLFGYAYFVPAIPLNVLYTQTDSSYPVYYGNVLKPSHTENAPDIQYNCEENTLWTLVMTNPDGHFTNPGKEYLHWFIGNIPGNNISKGETIMNYLQPFPPKGTGYHRHIFVLYKQDSKIDFSKYKKPNPCWSLEDRTFSTFDFYKSLQDKMTPAGLAFFQADWDPSLIDFYHNKLDMKHPTFEYDFPETYVKKQVWFPLKEAFNLYMDRHRDPKQINKEFLMRKLKNAHPFKPKPQPLLYPNAVRLGNIPSWLKLEKTKSRLKWGRINDIE